jgi:hypothetical protein
MPSPTVYPIYVGNDQSITGNSDPADPRRLTRREVIALLAQLTGKDPDDITAFVLFTVSQDRTVDCKYSPNTDPYELAMRVLGITHG